MRWHAHDEVLCETARLHCVLLCPAALSPHKQSLLDTQAHINEEMRRDLLQNERKCPIQALCGVFPSFGCVWGLLCLLEQ